MINAVDTLRELVLLVIAILARLRDLARGAFGVLVDAARDLEVFDAGGWSS